MLHPCPAIVSSRKSHCTESYVFRNFLIHKTIPLAINNPSMITPHGLSTYLIVWNWYENNLSNWIMLTCEKKCVLACEIIYYSVLHMLHHLLPKWVSTFVVTEMSSNFRHLNSGVHEYWTLFLHILINGVILRFSIFALS